MILILSSSLNADSNSRVLAREARRLLVAEGAQVDFVDLREHPLPLCDGDASYSDPNVERLAARIQAADAVLVATPIYNYDVSAALKNLIELTGRSWENKTVGFLCAAGGASSYMSVMAFANSLMLDFRSLIVPRFVYASGGAFAEGRIVDPEVADRVASLVRATSRLARALHLSSATAGAETSVAAELAGAAQGSS